MDKMGLEWTTDSMALLLMRSKHEDLQCFFEKSRLVWVIRYGYEKQGFDGPEWGVVHEASTLERVLDEYVHAEYFS